MIRRWYAVAALVVLGGGACQARNQARRDEVERAARAAAPHEPLLAPRPAPEERIESIAADDLFRLIRNGARLGTVVNVWATWCASCRQELPALAAEKERMRAEGIGLLLVSVDDAETQGRIPTILSEYGFAPPYYVARPPKSEFKRALHPAWSGELPVSLLFESGGKGRFFWDAPVTTTVLRSVLGQFVAEQSGACPVG